MNQPVSIAAASAAGDALGRLMALVTGYWGSAALLAAIELGIFEAMAEGVASAEDLARRCGCSRPHLEDLLRALEALSLLRSDPDGWRLAEDLAPYLHPGSPRSLIPAIAMNCDLFPLWGHLSQTIRDGCPPGGADRHLGADPDRTRRFVLAMHSRALALAEQMLPLVDAGPVTTLLDIGAGPGTWSRLLAERYPSLRVTLADLPPILEIARGLHVSSPAADRLAFLPADYRQHSDWGGPYQAIVFCGALHQETQDTAHTLFERLARHIEPDGRFIVVDLMRPDGAPPHPMAALFSLNMRLTSPHGRVWSVSEAVAALETAGWTVTGRETAAALPYWRLDARLAGRPHKT